MIGREGANVRAIESKSGATISFVDSGKLNLEHDIYRFFYKFNILKGGPLRLCVIRGGKENVHVAREMVLETIKEHGQVHTTEVNASQVRSTFMKFIAST